MEEIELSLLEIVLIALGLSMDAFAVSITLGLSVKKPKPKEIIIPGIFFGSFQALMPLIGFFAGIIFAERIQEFDHWIAFVLLGLIGGKMIKESFSKNKDEPKENSFKFIKMLVLAVGITFAFFQINIITAVIIIGFITFFISMFGVKIGSIFGAKFKSKAEFFGGAVLVLIGLKILIEHLFFQ
jgi:putative Mn2+ efflux pump MntP